MPQSTPQGKNPVECYKCGGRGHFAVVCPTRDQRFALVCEEDEIIGPSEVTPPSQSTDEEKNEGNEEHDEEVPAVELEASDLPVCVVRRGLTGCKQEENVEEDWRCINIFHTRVKHANKSLNLIIDNGSCMSIISEEVLKKLNLKPVPHPKPYRAAFTAEPVSTTLPLPCPKNRASTTPPRGLKPTHGIPGIRNSSSSHDQIQVPGAHSLRHTTSSHTQTQPLFRIQAPYKDFHKIPATSSSFGFVSSISRCQPG
ncbi:uncharacterized protein LOC120108132 [Phoenix dactylifera]|uniref:Uncharacterized protein LOC120108132 n=1 Tax=Phoenix dactylifera TaxID=42345 RepID=A0A8B9A2K5_PHODC|nr:uncharacterized protein LOC120108132 [Phoenix dactylifera]